MNQLKRNISGRTYYCEYAGKDFFMATKKKKAAKFVGWFTRLIKTKSGEYQLFISAY